MVRCELLGQRAKSCDVVRRVRTRWKGCRSSQRPAGSNSRHIRKADHQARHHPTRRDKPERRTSCRAARTEREVQREPDSGRRLLPDSQNVRQGLRKDPNATAHHNDRACRQWHLVPNRGAQHRQRPLDGRHRQLRARTRRNPCCHCWPCDPKCSM